MARDGIVDAARRHVPNPGVGWGAVLLVILAGCPSSRPAVDDAAAGKTTARESAAASTAVTLPPVVNAPPVLAVQPRFSDVAAAAGVQFSFFNDEVADRYFLPEVMGGGAAWIDFDVDGRFDLYLRDGSTLVGPDPAAADHISRLYRNLGGGRFREITPSAGQAGFHGYGQGCAVGDFNQDGFPDIFLANYGPNTLLQNNGDGTFSDVTAVADMADPFWGSSAVWLDLDDDGDLDLYGVNYLDVRLENLKVCRFHGKPGYCGPGDYEAQPDRVYRNEGDGRFVEAAESLGLTGLNGKGLAVAALDLDGDLRTEIYVANDMTPNFLFTRTPFPATAGGSAQPDTLYREVAMQAGCGVSDIGHNEASMGIATGDFDRDGLTDIFLSHFYLHKNTLYRNLGKLIFKDDSRRSRIAATGFDFNGFGTVVLDYDRDGAVDLFIANGHVLGKYQEPHQMHAQLLRNDGRGRFDDISAAAGAYFQELLLGRSVAASDYDDDGDLDFAVTHLHRPTALLRNDTEAAGHFLGLELCTWTRIPPIGGRVTVTAGDQRWVLPVVAGGSYLASHDPRLLVAIPSDGPVDVEVAWPGGERQQFTGLATDRYWRIYPGHDPEPRVPVSGEPE